MKQLFANNFYTTVASTFGAGDTYLNLTSVTGLPVPGVNEFIALTLYRQVGVEESGWEVVHVTDIVGNQCTVLRSQEGAAASQFLAGSSVEARASAGTFSSFETKANVATLSDRVSVAEADINSLESSVSAKADATATTAALDTKADKSNTYTKTEVNTALSTKADVATTYTKTEVDTIVANVSSGISGSGGTTLTGSQTIVASSPAAMAITPTAPGQYLTLPNATSMAKGTAPFSVYNAGDFDYGVKDAAGTKLGWIRAKTGAVIGLSDKTTSAGVWACYGLEKMGITASFSNSAVTPGSGGSMLRLALDANRTLFMFGGTTVYYVIYDASTQIWGAPAVVINTAGAIFNAIVTGADRVLIVYGATSSPDITAKMLFISGVGGTLQSPFVYTTPNSLTSFQQMVVVGTSFVLGYVRAGSGNVGAVIAMTVSGPTVAFGVETVLPFAGTNTISLFVSGAVLRTLSAGVNSNVYAKPYTVSGVTLTPGTQAVSANLTGSGLDWFRASLNSNGNIVCQYAAYAAIFKLTGTVEAVSQAALGIGAIADPRQVSDYTHLPGGKTVFAAGSATAACFANILTDTAGAASVGTGISILGLPVAAVFLAALGYSGNIARFSTNHTTSNAQIMLFSLNISGASPVLVDSQIYLIGTSLAAVAFPSNRFAVKNPLLLYTGSTAYALRNVSGVLATAFDSQFNDVYMDRKLGRMQNGITSGGVSGDLTTESYLMSTMNSNLEGLAIQKVELAA